MDEKRLKRLLKYIAVTALIAYMLFIAGIEGAYMERGYFAFGGEIFIPWLVAFVSACIYNRKEIIKSFLPEDDTEEQEEC